MKTIPFTKKVYIFYLVYFSYPISTSSCEETCGIDKRCLLKYYKDMPLPRRDPIKIGHISKISLESGKTHEVKTVSLKPPIFEIANFLTREECDEIIKLAKVEGLVMSSVMDEAILEDETFFTEDQKDVFDQYDYNKDGFMDANEVIHFFDMELDFSPDKEDVLNMFEEIDLDKDGDRLINFQEFSAKNVKGLLKFISRTKRTKPYTKSRNSNQTWLETNVESASVLHSLQKRLQKLTGLPIFIINASENLQVVSYEPRGHYNCHMDSDDIDEDQPCCHFSQHTSHDCRICRYLTVLYFLNDVEEGGETAFPLADNATVDEEALIEDTERICNVGRNCHKSNLRVKPEKGKAILWYNHLVNNETGWLGDSDPYSFHGGCDVIRGVKWIANNWLSVSENRTKDFELWTRLVKSTNESNNVFIDNGSIDDEIDDEIDELLNSVKNDDDIDSVLNSIDENGDKSTKNVEF